MRIIKKRLPESPSESTVRAKELRVKQSDAERRLWSKLRNKQTGDKFRRQEPIGDYIVDFVCIENGLIIELDGSQHCQDEAKGYDLSRDGYLESLGFRVLRFSNYDVLMNFDGVLSAIMQNLPPLSPLREPGGK